MYISDISILNFKNIKETEQSFSEKLNCFVGKNGEGKTNFLDSIYYISFCKSHTNPIDSQNILHGQEFFFIKATCTENNSDNIFSCGVKKHVKKTIQWNKKAYTKFSEHIGKVPLIIISPANEVLINEGSSDRRKFIDMVISQFDHNYIDTLIKYNNILKQRNTALKSRSGNNDFLFSMYNEMMEKYGRIIYNYRSNFIEKFRPVFEDFYNEISGGKEVITLEYVSDLQKGNLAELLEKNIEKDKIFEFTTAGIHKDDLNMKLNGYAIKKTGSQGQKKNFLIAMKLAEFRFLKKNMKTTPILLLDDMFDKLDSQRIENIINIISGNDFGQIFITETNIDRLSELMEKTGSNYKIFIVENGEIKEKES